MTLSLSIIILNYKTPQLSLACLESLVPALEEGEIAEVLMVDNASEDGSADAFQAHIDKKQLGARVQVIRSQRNGGFSAGNNLGLKQARGSHFLLLNSDTEVLSGSIEQLRAALVDTPDCGLMGAQLVGEDGARQNAHFRFISPISEFLNAASVGLLEKLLWRWSIALPLNDDPEARPCVPADWVSFAAVVVAKPVIEDIGLMDEEYFLYFEDVDYCQRARKAGWPVYQASCAKVVHRRGGSGPVKANQAKRKRLPRYYYESRTRYFKQHHGGVAGLLCANMLLYLGYAIGAVTKLYKRRHIQRVSGEWRDIWLDTFKPTKRGAYER